MYCRGNRRHQIPGLLLIAINARYMQEHRVSSGTSKTVRMTEIVIVRDLFLQLVDTGGNKLSHSVYLRPALGNAPY